MRYPFVLTLSVLIFLTFTKESFAQQFSTGVYPPVIQATMIPPADGEAEIDIANFSDTIQTYSIILKPFRPDPRGDGSITYPLSNALPEYTIFDSITIYDGQDAVDEVTINSAESKKLRIRFDIEENETRGDYYFSVIFLSSGTELNETSQSVIPSGVATNVLLTVGPKGAPIGEIKSFEAPTFSQSNPIPFTLEFLNAGKMLITPVGEVTITNMFGGEVDKVEILPEYILAESSRFLVDSSQASSSASTEIAVTHPVVIWDKDNMFGRYKATAEITLLEDESQKKMIATTTFYVIPVLSLIGTSFITLIIVIIYLRVRKKI